MIMPMADELIFNNSGTLLPATNYTSWLPYSAGKAFNITSTTETTNVTSLVDDRPYPPSGYAADRIILAAVCTVLLVFSIVFGNTLVCIAILRERSLKGIQNWFLLSLAVSDLMVGVLIIPFGITNELMGYWIFGLWWCHIWLCLDVMACTASILNLCLISLDRYWSITQALEYAKRRTPRRAAFMIFLVWLLSGIISIPPLFGWRSDDPPDPVYPICLLSEDTGYILYSTSGSFFIPAFVMIVVYVRIWYAAKSRARTSLRMARAEKRSKQPKVDNHKNKNHHDIPMKRRDYQKISAEETTTSSPVPSSPGMSPRSAISVTDVEPSSTNITTITTINEVDGRDKNENSRHLGTNSTKLPLIQVLQLKKSNPNNHHVVARSHNLAADTERQKRKVAQAKERRATFVLGVIMGTFLLSWLPFFVLYVIFALCKHKCAIPDLLFKFFFWIGYCNSAANPVIYTIFNRDFNKAFKKIVQCK
ncbi:alpha-2C adrenergic receptor-like [Ptychodera flava]|uniref:alpha-2C adrenergic receptor-like n=1 Tax=Ptychodera flava TaxID=63121 RepID=UPI00396A1F70